MGDVTVRLGGEAAPKGSLVEMGSDGIARPALGHMGPPYPRAEVDIYDIWRSGETLPPPWRDRCEVNIEHDQCERLTYLKATGFLPDGTTWGLQECVSDRDLDSMRGGSAYTQLVHRLVRSLERAADRKPAMRLSTKQRPPDRAVQHAQPVTLTEWAERHRARKAPAKAKLPPPVDAGAPPAPKLPAPPPLTGPTLGETLSTDAGPELYRLPRWAPIALVFFATLISWALYFFVLFKVVQ